MHNLLVLGTARSGTSLVASLFRNAGCYCGDNYIPPRVSNPRGFFEDSVINWINDVILGRLLLTKLLRRLPGFVRPRVISDGRALWLAAPRFLPPVPLPAGILERMRERAGRSPFCYKDPRFTFTLRYWRPWLPLDTRFLVVFRDAASTAASMLREAEEGHYIPPIKLTLRDAHTTWRRGYANILAEASEGGFWFFVNFNSILDHSALPAMAAFAGAELETTIIDAGLSRSSAPGVSSSLYEALCERAEEDKRRWTR